MVISVQINTHISQDEDGGVVSRQTYPESKNLNIEDLKKELKKHAENSKSEIHIIHPKTHKKIQITNKQRQQIINHVDSEESLEIYLDSLEKAKQQRIDDLSKENK